MLILATECKWRFTRNTLLSVPDSYKGPRKMWLRPMYVIVFASGVNLVAGLSNLYIFLSGESRAHVATLIFGVVNTLLGSLLMGISGVFTASRARQRIEALLEREDVINVSLGQPARKKICEIAGLSYVYTGDYELYQRVTPEQARIFRDAILAARI